MDSLNALILARSVGCGAEMALFFGKAADVSASLDLRGAGTVFACSKVSWSILCRKEDSAKHFALQWLKNQGFSYYVACSGQKEKRYSNARRSQSSRQIEITCEPSGCLAVYRVTSIDAQKRNHGLELARALSD